MHGQKANSTSVHKMASYKSGNILHLILEISKVRITMAVSLTTIAGYMMASRNYQPGFVLPAIGIFLLACGSSVINHLQERHTDAIMERTRQRPLPSKKISVRFAVMVALAEAISGSLILFFTAGLVAFLLGLLAMAWYNLVYTNLKRITANAVIPGSLIGAIPPLVGWTASGAGLFQIQALVMAVFFFVWQVPHFYLLAIKHGKEYEQAGLPSLTSAYSLGRLKMHIFVWIVFTALSSVTLPLAGLSDSIFTAFIISIAAGWLLYSFICLIRFQNSSFNPGKYFIKINYFFLLTVLMLILDPAIYRLLKF
jgi:protoheme IX farnesyltransferase